MRTTIDKQFFERWKNRNVSMWCKNKVYAFEFCKIMDKYGLTNLNGASYLSDENLQNLKNETTFHFNTGNIGYFLYDSNTDCIVLDFENYIINPETYREECDLKNKELGIALRLAKDMGIEIEDIEGSKIEIYIDGKLMSEKELENTLRGKHRKTNGLNSGLQTSKK